MNVVQLTLVGNEIEAEIVCGLLRSNGIQCSHRRSDLGSGIAAFSGRFSMEGPTEILVREDDLEDARSLLEQDEEPEPAS
jgi:hypothetical protein